MEQKKELTRKLIAQSFKGLMQKYPFEKITIKMISDEAGVIRPTFYNHFRDKYDLLEWIFNTEIIEEARSLLSHGMKVEAIKFIFRCLISEKTFYRKAFLLTGQNSFEDIVIKYFTELFLFAMEKQPATILPKDNSVLTPENIAEFYTIGLVTFLKKWLTQTMDDQPSPDDLLDAFTYVLTHSLADFIEGGLD